MVIGSRQVLKWANDIEIYLDNEILDVVTTFDSVSQCSNCQPVSLRIRRLITGKG